MLNKIATRLNDEVFRRVFDQKTTIFLCGKSRDERDSLRRRIADEFHSSSPYHHRYLFVYPEELFEELLSGPFHQDLLTLEAQLADSVDAVVLVPESYGAVAELGAFANHEKLRKKLICVQEIKYRNKKSFINYGPIRLLKDHKAGKVIYIDRYDIAAAVVDIKKAVADIQRQGIKGAKPKKSLNEINADRFLLPSIYIFEEPDLKLLTDLVVSATKFENKRAAAIVTAGLSLLRKKGYVTRAAGGVKYLSPHFVRADECYKLTTQGMTTIRNMNQRGKWDHYYNPQILDQIRVDILKSLCRGRRALLKS